MKNTILEFMETLDIQNILLWPPHNQNYWLNKYFKYSLLIVFKQALILTVTALWMCTPVYREPGWLIDTVTEDLSLVLG